MISKGAMVKSYPQTFSTADFSGWPGESLLLPASYDKIYRSQLWVYVLVNKRARACTRLPLKVYAKDGLDRQEQPDSAYQKLLSNPSRSMSALHFYSWIWHTLDINGIAPIAKIRDRGGRPVELIPLHPTRLDPPDQPGSQIYRMTNDLGERFAIHRRDLMLPRTFNPSAVSMGVSPLEPLRATLENDAGAKEASSSTWRNGGRPSVVLTHSGRLSDPARGRIARDWEARHAGVTNWSKPVILEEGLTFEQLSQTSEDLQYILTRKLNREESCAAYDVPPTLVGILDNATFSNVSAQMISLYRDTITPLLTEMESLFDFELRDGRFGDMSIEPDFGDNLTAEFLLDQVLRGDWEARTGGYQKLINSGVLTPAEARRYENLPEKDGSDELLINSTLIPLVMAGENMGAGSSTDPMQDTLGGANGTESVDDLKTVRSIMGRLGRIKTVQEIDPLTLDPTGTHTETIGRMLTVALTKKWDVEMFRELLKEALR